MQEPDEDGEPIAMILARAEDRAGRLCTVEEIFEVAFKAGLSKAGLTESHRDSYEHWLLKREGLA